MNSPCLSNDDLQALAAARVGLAGQQVLSLPGDHGQGVVDFVSGACRQLRETAQLQFEQAPPLRVGLAGATRRGVSSASCTGGGRENVLLAATGLTNWSTWLVNRLSALWLDRPNTATAPTITAG